MFSDTELSTAVSNYKKCRAHADFHIKHIKDQKHFSEAIVMAAKAIDASNKIHSHQRRVGRRKLEEFANKVAAIEPELQAADTFDVLYSLIENLKVPGIGALTVYDTALRIAHTKSKCLPDKIYLHTGTRKGARQIVPHLAARPYIYKTDLPTALKESDLNNAELEDLLCHIVSKRNGISLTDKTFNCRNSCE